MRTDRVVVDVEIQKTIEETPGGWDATDKLGVACGVVYEALTDRFRVYGPDDVEALRERVHKADQIIGFNVLRFDLPVIFGVPKFEWSQYGHEALWQPKVNDLLLRIWRALGFDDSTFGAAHKGWNLDAVCRGTLGRGKIGHGAKAPIWFQAGQWGRLVNYCLDDVALERDLSNFIDRHGYVCNGVQVSVGPWGEA